MTRPAVFTGAQPKHLKFRRVSLGQAILWGCACIAGFAAMLGDAAAAEKNIGAASRVVHLVTGALAPTEPPAVLRVTGSTELQIVRTVPEKIYDFMPRGDFRILESYLRALRGAERFVYLESQFLWSPEVTFVLADKLRRPPSDDFRRQILPVHTG